MLSDEEYYQDLLHQCAAPSSPHAVIDHLECVSGAIDEIDVSSSLAPVTSGYQGPAAWSAREEARLERLVKKYRKNWGVISKHFQGRTRSEIEYHWRDNQEYANKRARWSPEEDQTILDLYIKSGPDWKQIAKHLKGRHPDTIKNRFYGTIKKRLSPGQEKQVQESKQLHRKSNSFLIPFVSHEQPVTPETQEKLIESMLVGLAGEQDLGLDTLSMETPTLLSPEEKQRKLKELLHMSVVYETMISQTKQELDKLKK